MFWTVSAIRQANLEILSRGWEGQSGEDIGRALVAAALATGNQELAQECRVGEAVVLINSGHTSQGRKVLDSIVLSVGRDSDLPLSDWWAWHYEQARAQVALDLADHEGSWTHHSRARDLAYDLGDEALIGESRMKLAHLATRADMLGDALVELSEVVTLPGVEPATLVGAHLLLAVIHGRHEDLDLAEHHSGVALDLASASPGFSASRTLWAIAGLVLEGDSFDWLVANMERVRVIASTGRSRHTQLEFELLRARVLHRSGENSRAKAVLYEVVDGAPHHLAVRTEALVELTSVLVASGDCVEALEISGKALEMAAQPAGRAHLLELRAEAFSELSQWRSAFDAWHAAARATKSQSLSVLTLYELQREELLAEEIKAQNAELEERNAELVALSLEHQAMINAIGNTLQSPLTALQLNLELLAREESGRNIADRTVASKRVVSRLGRVANQLTLAGELEAGPIVSMGEWVEVSVLFGHLSSAASEAVDSHRVELNINIDELGVGDLVYLDVERSVQLVGILCDGIVEVSSAGMMVDLLLGMDDRSRVVVELRAPMLKFDPTRFEGMRFDTKPDPQVSGTPGVLDPNNSSDLSFYLAARLGSALGCELDATEFGDSGTRLVLGLPVPRRQVVTGPSPE